MNNDNQIDILAIGDIATEPFIKINDAEAKCDLEGEHCKLCLTFGGKIPYESALICHAVGNSSNVAIGASRLGLNSYLASYIGNDNSGKENIEQLTKENVHTNYVSTIDGLESNYHFVLWYGTERTILVKHTEFPYSFPLKEIKEPKWIYLSSLASNSTDYHKEIISYIKEHKNVSLAFQPGTFQIKLGAEALKDIYENSKVFFSNYEEAVRILKVEEKDLPLDKNESVTKLLKMVYDLGPKIVVITDNINGSYAYDGNDVFYMKAFFQNVVESTGAGDAFSCAFTTALVLDKDIKTALMWGAANAASVISYVGPHKGLLNKNQIEEYVLKVEDDYKPIKIN
jgi:sugar/nucleoside kinase (ribokinase family)